MKPIILITSLFVFISLGAIEYPNTYHLPHTIDGSKIPGVKPILGDYLYMSVTEVSNYQYVQFLNWLNNEKPDEYTPNLPDTTRWRTSMAYNEPYVNNYLRHPAYADYPVVNISQAQAQNYCRYLHTLLAEAFQRNHSLIQEFVVRLPSEKEWILAARGGLPETAIYPWGTDEIRNTGQYGKRHGEYLLNCTLPKANYERIPSMLSSGGFITTPVKSYYANGYGLYNMSGNVAEWILEKGKTKGGSWKLPPYNARIDVPGYQDGDSTGKSDVGFRYVVEVISVANKPNESSKVDASSLSADLLFVPNNPSSNHLMYAGEHEITNAEYNEFLKENNQPEYRIQASRWSGYFPYRYFELYGSLSAFDHYPVVNITYEAAQAYCTWATQKYNQSPKRKFQKVVFKLPTEKEWEYAASGGRDYYVFPWGGPYIRNSRGCYLCNFAPLEDQYYYKKDSVVYYNSQSQQSPSRKCVDGLLIPGDVKSYFPNVFGMYNCAGNVAEMINEIGITKGGSWNSNDQGVTLNAQEKYTEPSPNIGFRVFMEVLEQ